MPFCIAHMQHPYGLPLVAIKLKMCVSQDLAKLGGGGEAHKMSGMEGGVIYSKLCNWGGWVSKLALMWEGVM